MENLTLSLGSVYSWGSLDLEVDFVAILMPNEFEDEVWIYSNSFALLQSFNGGSMLKFWFLLGSRTMLTELGLGGGIPQTVKFLLLLAYEFLLRLLVSSGD